MNFYPRHNGDHKGSQTVKGVPLRFHGHLLTTGVSNIHKKI